MGLPEGSKILRGVVMSAKRSEVEREKDWTGVVSPGYFLDLDHVRSKIRK